ncbi:F0F1 ATP synthase subunit B [Lactobacillus sp. PV037]|uniref:F0F1 ATP synthase subunit B n=1 Tax=unclassified Lactobacillus TaxID=2620435 RepID=UPI00223F69E0|nr:MULTISPECIES: F0F1 ATP synthase subunit B [unclassified Lactobacillus]QNQ82497.1 F0F1 ATP synthase subunit B [Lactobacillus sp. PV012]QNQ83389.1 F0F1 ATP synthase subunit B [Lactobacillus sp. PV037]
MQFMFAALKLELGDTFYYLFIFAVLLVLVKHFAWGPVTSMMEKRREKIITDIEQAEDDRKKAELLANKREAELKNSRQEATQILSTAKSNAEKTKASIISDADTEAAAIRKKATAEAAQAKTDALNEARDQVADLSVAIAEKVIAKNLSAADQKDLVDQFIKGLND